MTRFTTALGVCAMGAAALACNEQPTDPEPAELVIVQAPSSVGAPGWALIDTLVIRTVDPSGTPRGGVAVNWWVQQGGGAIAPTAETTDADGYGRAVWTLGSTSGVNKVSASTPAGGQVEFQSTGTAFRVDRLVSGYRIACGLRGGALWCWGENFWDHGTPVSTAPDVAEIWNAPSLVDDSHEFIELTLSNGGVCALDAAFAVWCIRAGDPGMIQVAGIPPVRRLAASPERQTPSCGLAAGDSTLWCWQMGGAGSQALDSLAFIGVWLDRLGSDSLGCGLLGDSSAVCWGKGPLGDGTTSSSGSPVAVEGGHRFTELAVGGGFACGLTVTWEVWCWGDSGVLSPSLVATGAVGIATEDQWIQVLHGDGRMTRGVGADFGAYHAHLTGFSGLSMLGFSDNNGLACIRTASGETYCYQEMFMGIDWVGDNIYMPIQPIRQVPLTSVSP